MPTREQTPLEPEHAELALPMGEEEPQQSFLQSLTSQTPWWVVSTLFHGLFVVLVGLATLTVETPEQELMIVRSTYDTYKPVDHHEKELSTPNEAGAVLSNFDPSKPESNIYIFDNFRGEESDHFETKNLDLHGLELGAHGNPDALSMHDTLKPTEKPGAKGDFHQVGVIEEMIGAGPGEKAFSAIGNGFGVKDGDGTGIRGFPNKAGQHNRFIKYNPREAHRMREWNDAVGNALRWLAYHQETDGHWDVKKYGAGSKNDTAITALALLAFLGNGQSEKVGEYKDNVKRAVAWMISKQRADGLVWDSSDDASGHRQGGYPMAIATLALAESGAMANIPATRAAAQKAVDYCVNIHQAGDEYNKLGWRYAPKSEGDLSVTGWFIMALKAAKVAGLRVPAQSFDGAIKFIESVEVKEKGGDPGYEPPSRFKYMVNNDHISTAHRLTAIATLARQFLGWKKEDLQASVEWFVAKGGVPEYGGNGEKVDLYYWYYGSMACFQQGGALFEKWGHAMLDSLLPSQRKDGDDAGSWNPTGDYSDEWGRVGQTALSALCLEVYYRKDRVFGK